MSILADLEALAATLAMRGVRDADAVVLVTLHELGDDRFTGTVITTHNYIGHSVTEMIEVAACEVLCDHCGVLEDTEPEALED